MRKYHTKKAAAQCNRFFQRLPQHTLLSLIPHEELDKDKSLWRRDTI